jgi:DNA polymerase
MRVPATPPFLPTSLPGPIAFVGEAPGDEEVEKGRPLVGPSGRVFNAVLRTVGLERKECWVGNVFEEQLPGNDVAAWCMGAAEAREMGWTGEVPAIPGVGVLRPERAWHLERLRKEMEALKPSLIVPLGATALWAFTGIADIGECRGAPAYAKYIAPGVKVFPTFHPAHILRDWRFFAVVVGDIVRAVEEAKRGPSITLPTVEAVLEPTLGTLGEWKARLLGADLLSVDIETGWGFITCVGFAPSPREALVVPFVDLRSPSRSYWETEGEELEALGFVKEVMEAPVPKLGQNFAAYDAYWFLERWAIRPKNLREDTRILHHALYPELPKDLAFMGASYTDQGPWKTMRGRTAQKKED